MIDKNFKYTPTKPRAVVTKNNVITDVAKQKTMSWAQLFIICMTGVLFLFALTSRILYEYRTDDTSNLEVVVGSCTFKNNVLIKYDESDSIVNIPNYYEIDGEQYGITAIAGQVFYSNSNIQKITMPNQITSVGLFAFRECVNLESIILSNKLETLGDSCFWNCSKLTTIHLPTSLTRIDPYAFWNTAIETIDIPESCKKIGLGAFNNCSKLETVYIRSNELVTTSFTEAYQTFSRCPNLTTIYVPENLLDQYKTHELWSLYADKFQAIGGNTNA